MKTFISAVALTAIGAALGAASYGVAAAPAATPATAVVRAMQHGHAYQTGGIGHDEVVAMDRAMARYSLRMRCSEGRDNAFAAGVELKVFDAAGHRIFHLRDAGPMTDLALPAGRYEVQARFGGVDRSANVVIPSGAPATVALHWPKDER